MIRKNKAFGLALVAMFALSAFAAQAASATPLTSPVSTTYITGDGHTTPTHLRITGGSTVTCNKTVYASKSTAGTSINELTITPTYSECTAFGFATAHVKTNGCTYTFTTPSTRIKAGEVTWHPSDLHVLCPVGKSIEITPTSFGASVCTQFIGEQTPTGGHIVGTNAGTPTEMDVTLDITLKEIHYTSTGEPCGKGGGVTNTNAELEGNSTVRCFSDEKHLVRVDCTFS